MTIKRNTVLKPIVFALCLVPFALLAFGAEQMITGRNPSALGANPVERITHQTGLWTLRLLLITLAITPLRRLTQVQWLIQYRRMMGLFAFFYGCLHISTWVILDHQFDVMAMAHDIAKRPFITMGTLSYLLMVPLALTSTQGMMRRLGKRWQKLHRLVYVSAAAGSIHFIWLVKKDIREPLIYFGILTILLAFRSVNWLRAQSKTKSQAPQREPVAAE